MSSTITGLLPVISSIWEWITADPYLGFLIGIAVFGVAASVLLGMFFRR